MNKLILLRHGQSQWNLENRFTGWKDIELTDKGIQEAKNAVHLLKDFKLDLAFTSNLKRAQNTLSIILDGLHLNLKICLLNVDIDFVESTHCVLENLYDKVVKGGVIISEGLWE